MCASSFGHPDIVEVLAKASADVNRSNKTGTTALISAATSQNNKGGHRSIIRTLLAADADVAMSDKGSQPHIESPDVKTSLYIGNISENVKTSDLKEFVIKCGGSVVGFCSKTWVCVTYNSFEEAEKAMECLQGQDFGGNDLKVQMASQKNDGSKNGPRMVQPQLRKGPSKNTCKKQQRRRRSKRKKMDNQKKVGTGAKRRKKTHEATLQKCSDMVVDCFKKKSFRDKFLELPEVGWSNEASVRIKTGPHNVKELILHEIPPSQFETFPNVLNNPQSLKKMVSRCLLQVDQMGLPSSLTLWSKWSILLDPKSGKNNGLQLLRRLKAKHQESPHKQQKRGTLTAKKPNPQKPQFSSQSSTDATSARSTTTAALSTTTSARSSSSTGTGLKDINTTLQTKKRKKDQDWNCSTASKKARINEIEECGLFEPVKLIHTISGRVIVSQSPARMYKYIRGKKFPSDETRFVEFKDIAPHVSHIAVMLSKYLNGYLNTEGGILLCGVSDDGFIKGVSLDMENRDLIRQRLDAHVSNFRPALDNGLYHVSFIAVYDEGTNLPIEGLVMILLVATRGLFPVYRNLKGAAYARFDGSLRQMSEQVISTRIGTQNRLEIDDQDRFDSDYIRKLTEEYQISRTAACQALDELCLIGKRITDVNEKLVIAKLQNKIDDEWLKWVFLQWTSLRLRAQRFFWKPLKRRASESGFEIAPEDLP